MKWLNALRTRYWRRGERKDGQVLKFLSLTPTKDAENVDSYSAALDYALSRDDVLNIAVTGRYGAGKSTLLKTYFYARKDVLWISLASFLKGTDGRQREVSEAEGEEDESAKLINQSERLLEFSILQQMFYIAKNSELPFSRFKRLSIPSGSRYLLVLLGLIVVLTAVAGVFQPSFLVSRTWGAVGDFVTLHSNGIFWLSLTGLGLFLSVGWWLLRNFTKNVRSMNLNVENLGLEFKGESSIFNRYLDEIVYFFQTLDYRVVIFEDIDRFGDTEIFTKLREINQLVNRARQIPDKKKPIRFIYALKDDMFINKDKVKFFDFLVPVVPVINASNSDAAIFKALNETGAGEDIEPLKGVVKAISHYVSDMRLLKNVANEYIIYKNLIPDCARADSLFAMVVFKNFFPAEFASLHDGRGILGEVLKAKNAVITGMVEKVQQEIGELTERILQIKAEALTDVRELNMIYLGAIVRYTSPGIPCVTHKGSWRHIQELPDDVLGSLLGRNIGTNNGEIRWNKLEELVPSKLTYVERRSLIEDKSNGRIEELRGKIERLKAKLSEIRRSSVLQLIKAGEINFGTISGVMKGYEEADCHLFYALVSRGYLAEDYAHYISVFTAGRLCETDYYFKINVTQGAPANWNAKLENVEELVGDLEEQYFSQESILNFKLFTYLLAHGGAKLEAFLSLLTTEGNVKFDFISEYLANIHWLQGKRDAFGRILKKDPRYFDELLDYSNLVRGKIEQQLGLYLYEVLCNDELEVSEEIRDFISDTSDLPAILEKNELASEQQVTDIFSRTGAKLRGVDFQKATKSSFFDAMLKGDAYELSAGMLKGILTARNVDVGQFDSRGYSLIVKSGLDTVKEYVKENFSEYLSFRNDEPVGAQAEDADVIVELLNGDMPIELKTMFLSKERDDNKLSDITKIKTVEALKLVLDKAFMLPTWSNVLYCYEYWSKLSEELTRYLNQASNYEMLKQNKHPGAWDSVSSFALAVATSAQLTEEAVYSILTGLQGGHISDYDGENATPDRITTLSRAHRIDFSAGLYTKLRSANNKSHAMLAATFERAFLRAANELEISGDDVLEIFSAIDERDTGRVLDYILKLKDIITQGEATAGRAAGYVTESNFKSIPEQVLRAGFPWLRPPRLQCGVIQHICTTREDAQELLSKMNDPYCNLAEMGKRPTLEPWDGLESFLEYLTSMNIVSTYSPEDDGRIRVNTKLN